MNMNIIVKVEPDVEIERISTSYGDDEIVRKRKDFVTFLSTSEYDIGYIIEIYLGQKQIWHLEVVEKKPYGYHYLGHQSRMVWAYRAINLQAKKPEPGVSMRGYKKHE